MVNHSDARLLLRLGQYRFLVVESRLVLMAAIKSIKMNIKRPPIRFVTVYQSFETLTPDIFAVVSGNILCAFLPQVKYNIEYLQLVA